MCLKVCLISLEILRGHPLNWLQNSKNVDSIDIKAISNERHLNLQQGKASFFLLQLTRKRDMMGIEGNPRGKRISNLV